MVRPGAKDTTGTLLGAFNGIVGVDSKPLSNRVPARGTTKGVVEPTGATAVGSVARVYGTSLGELI